MSFGGWILQLLIAIDQLLNVLVTPFSAGAWADETLSSRAYRMDRDGKPWGRITRPLIDFLFAIFLVDNHCKGAYEREVQRRDSPPEQRSAAIGAARAMNSNRRGPDGS